MASSDQIEARIQLVSRISKTTRKCQKEVQKLPSQQLKEEGKTSKVARDRQLKQTGISSSSVTETPCKSDSRVIKTPFLRDNKPSACTSQVRLGIVPELRYQVPS